MKKYLLNALAVTALQLAATAAAWAGDVVYGLVPSYSYGAQAASFDISSVSADAAATVTKDFAFETAKEVKCGVTAGDKYFAFVETEDANYNQTVALVTLNFTSGEMVVVNDFSYKYGKPGYNASGMAYDDVNGKLYATEITFNDQDEYVTTLYSVNMDDGSMAYVTEWTGQYQAIAADHKGGFYLLQNVTDNTKVYPNLYKVSPSFGISQAVSNTELSAGWSSYNSMAVSADGKKVYLVESKKVLEFDTEAATVALKGTLSDNVAAISYGKSSANGTHNEAPQEDKTKTRFLVKTTMFGSTMGDIPTDTESKHEYYYYNTAGQIVGSAYYGREYAEDGSMTNSYSPTDIMKSRFDDMGNITNKDIYQWGIYDFDDHAWKKSTNSESFTYDADGKLATDTVGMKYYVYAYNEDGTLATKKEYSKSGDNLLQTITYSNYDQNGNPWHYSAEGSFDYNTYEAELAYDEDGNLVQQFTYKVVADPENPEWTVNQMKNIETWTYEDGMLTLYTKNNFDDEGNEVPSLKTEYTPVDGDKNVVLAKEYSYYNGNWYNNSMPRQYTYADFADMAEMTQMESAAEADPELKNTVDLYFSVPQLAMSQDCRVVIYRDCIPVDTVSVFDVYDDMSGVCAYKDKNLKNGTYTYFLQPLFAAYNEWGVMDEGDDNFGVDEEPVEWVGYYSTQPVTVSVSTDLPAVANLKLAGGRIEKQGNILQQQKVYYADLAWDNPTDAAEYGFLKNSIYFTGAGVAEKDTADINAADAEVMLYGDDVKAFVVTSYQLGKAISDTIDVKIADIDRLTDGITPVTAAGATSVTFSGNTVSLGANANISVFSTGGERVADKKDTDCISLSSLPKGTYVICVEKDGKTSAYKYTVR